MSRRVESSTEPALKRELLVAARRIFADAGIEAISMRKVAAEVGCTATAIYLYFKDKETLMESLVLDDFLEIAHQLEASRDEPDPVLRLRKFALALLDYGRQKPHHYRFLFMTPRPEVRPELLLERNRPELNAYLLGKEAAQAALDAGRIHPRYKDADEVVQVLHSAIHGVISLHVSNFNDPWIPWKPLDERADLMLETFFEGLCVN